ncbi:MAG TPA: ABC transporter ATP-binding protein [Gammaproteobacteria bacterium]|nr:ABC transporter ATP-binding protein [Gammaproteobacteria bacterium]
MSIIHAQDVTKAYQAGEVTVQALRGVTFDIERGSFVSFVGASGSGKTTLLNLIGCLDRPTSGQLTVLGTDVTTLDRKESALFRGQNIGFIFQDFNLLPVLSVYENVEYPLIMVQSWPEHRRRERVMELLGAVGMADQAQKRPDQISGGQKQRVAVARALAPDTKVVLADEPTANLDSQTAHRVIGLMHQLKAELGVTFAFSTHDPKIMAAAEIIYHLEDGRVTNIERTREVAHG